RRDLHSGTSRATRFGGGRPDDAANDRVPEAGSREQQQRGDQERLSHGGQELSDPSKSKKVGGRAQARYGLPRFRHPGPETAANFVRRLFPSEGLPLDCASIMTTHPGLESWVRDMALLCQPDQVVWCDGSPEEYQRMLRLLVQGGTAQWLDSAKRPNSIFVRS